MNIRPIHPEEFESARALLSACGWTKKIEDPEVFEACVRASQIALVAEVGGQIVGFLRAITDGIFNGYISMVAVAPERQGTGIGKALVNAALGTNPNITWVLRADRAGVQGFYTSLGFEQSTVAMERRRQ
ncbi:MAG: family acetyltransferase [Nevskia sp.]|nr:family acetyltransferase [Nevskia sp.]